MKIKCHLCGNYMKKEMGTHHYQESGLDNIHLHNIPIYECACGSRYPSLLRIGRLNELIAKELLKKNSLLSGNEIKFLRKNIYFSSKDFASELGVGKTTLSKWENEHQPHSEQNDRLVRTIYMIHKGLKKREAQKILSSFAKVHLENSEIPYSIIAELFQDDYLVSMHPIIETQTPKINRELFGIRKLHPSNAATYATAFVISIVRVNQMFSAKKLLNSGSESYTLGVGDYQYASQKA
jgi:putative zinc finger/helix-turn-helix YgiT family protein